MSNEIIGAFFTDDGDGATGLTVTVSMIRIAKDSGNPTLVINEQAMTEDSNIDGFYWYRAGNIDTENNTYLIRAKTTGTADVQELAGEIWTDTNAIESATALNQTALINGIWSNSTRTLTTSLSAASSAGETGVVTMIRGDDNDVAITVGDITGWTTISITVKDASTYETSTDDDDAIIKWTEAAGLVRLNGSSTTSSWGAIDVVDATAGSIQLRLDKEASSLLSPTTTNYILDCQIDDADGNTITKAFGELKVTADVTRSIS